ncbi:MAG TPA: hypothetical protein DHV12_09735 [Thermotogae bacterium]|nr:hypothetical protein [Thermotogota bacterium]
MRKTFHIIKKDRTDHTASSLVSTKHHTKKGKRMFQYEVFAVVPCFPSRKHSQTIATRRKVKSVPA